MKGGDTLPRIKSRSANLVFEHKSVICTLSVTPGSNITKCNWLKDLIHSSAKKKKKIHNIKNNYRFSESMDNH